MTPLTNPVDKLTTQDTLPASTTPTQDPVTPQSTQQFATRAFGGITTDDGQGDGETTDTGGTSGDAFTMTPAGSLTDPSTLQALSSLASSLGLEFPGGVAGSETTAPTTPPTSVAGASADPTADPSLNPLSSDGALLSRLQSYFPDQDISTTVGDVLENGWDNALDSSRSLERTASEISDLSFDASDFENNGRGVERKLNDLTGNMLEAGKEAGELAKWLDGVLGGKVVEDAANSEKIFDRIGEFVDAFEGLPDTLGNISQLAAEAGVETPSYLDELGNLGMVSALAAGGGSGGDLAAGLLNTGNQIASLLAGQGGTASALETSDAVTAANGFGLLNEVLQRQGATIGKGIEGGDQFGPRLAASLSGIPAASSSAMLMG